ncbi:hypothetical protein JTE90_027142 [Oedothorax gibbosus]|uniref:Transposase n=1 Tax=Oedothorax gibbosus TaxID=931172 RepID=A0AAV6TRL8_9ARAC|nr:hypothetical protein JTE90_027142 [Oedothorax gibbosus]
MQYTLFYGGIMVSSNIVAGIDVSKGKLDIHIHPLGHYKMFENNAQAIDKILDFLHLYNVTKVGLEATGGYEKLCAHVLLANGFEVFVVQPRWVRDYAKSLGITTKTDKIDCNIISRYIDNSDMRVTPLKVSNIDFLKQKLSRRNQLVEIAKIQKTQAHQITDTYIIKQIEELIVLLQNQIKALENEMIAFIDQNQELKRKYISITSIPGASKITAITMICYLPELGTLRHKEISSLSGVAPFNRDSGFSKGKREEVTVAKGQNLSLGAVIAEKAEDNLIRTLNPTATDGTQNAIGVIASDINAKENLKAVIITRIALLSDHAIVWPPATDGTQTAIGVITSDVNATETTKAVIITRIAMLADHAVVWPANITEEQKAAAIKQLEARGIIIRKGV